MKNVKFINSYSFIFSPRPGTPSSKLKQIESDLSKERLNVFQKTSDEIKKEYRKNLLNYNSKVLFENKLKNSNKYFGRDEYLNSVIVESETDLTGALFSVKIKDFNHNTLFGELFKSNNVAA